MSEKKPIEERRTCPKCGGSLIRAPVSGGSMGVGKTYAQAKMRGFTVHEEIVCSKCGLVLGTTDRKVQQ